MQTKLVDRYILYVMALVSGVSLACYTAVVRLCSQEAREQRPERVALRTRLANEEPFGSQDQPRWLKVSFMLSGPLPTIIRMAGAMITSHRWGPRLGSEPLRRCIHRGLAWLGHVNWWFSYLPIFAQPLLNRLSKERNEAVEIVDEK